MLHAALADPAPDPLHAALLDSRQRWRDLVAISADIAFETDAAGRFVFISPAVALGWPADILLDQPSDASLLPEPTGTPVFNPFCVTTAIRSQRVWMQRPDGTPCWISVSAAPLHDSRGTQIGTRGLGRDVTNLAAGEAATARTLRRCELIDHIVWHMRTEIIGERMLDRALTSLIGSFGAEAAMVVNTPGLPSTAPPPACVGTPDPAVLALMHTRLQAGLHEPTRAHTPDGHECLLAATPTRYAGAAGLVIWRQGGHPTPWSDDDRALLGSVIGTVCVALEHGAIQAEMARRALTDPLTGLPNRRSFAADAERRVQRLDRDTLPSTLLSIDVAGLTEINQAGGFEAGDTALLAVAGLLRQTFRPGDLIARLGGDRFAVWLDGADELAAAERAEQLRLQAPTALAGADGLPIATVTVGIAARWPNDGIEVCRLLTRAESAMRQARRRGPGHWLVWHGEGEP